jgi:hypothetical protein
VTKLLGFIGLTLGSYLGWAAGAPFSMGAAIMLSMVGSGVGLYVGRRIARDYF